MTRLNGDPEHDLAAILVALERSAAKVAAREAEPTEADRKEIERIVARQGHQ